LLKEAKKYLVVGIGNPLRSDDGLGPLIVQKIEEKNLPGVQVRIAHQLNIELLEEVGKYDKILLVDASYLEEGLVIKKVQSLDHVEGASSHHLSPEFFRALAQKLYNQHLNLYLCAVRGQNFEMGETISLEVHLLIPKAIEEISAFLTEK
jgi:hydrogenase maturation protease